MINSLLLALGAVPAILYKKGSLKDLYRTCVKWGMTFQELTQVLHIEPSLLSESRRDFDGESVEVFEYETNALEKYVMVFINGKLDRWYTELKGSLLK